MNAISLVLALQAVSTIDADIFTTNIPSLENQINIRAAVQPLAMTDVFDILHGIVVESSHAEKDPVSQQHLFDIHRILGSQYRCGFTHIQLSDTHMLSIFIDATAGWNKVVFQYAYIPLTIRELVSNMIAGAIAKANSQGFITAINEGIGAGEEHANMWLNITGKGNVSVFQNLSYRDADSGLVIVNVLMAIEPSVMWDLPLGAPSHSGAGLLLVSNALNDSAMGIYINNIGGSDSEGLEERIRNIIADNRAAIESGHCLAIHDDNIVVGENTYAYFMRVHPKNIREVLILQNPSEDLKGILVSQLA